MKAGCLPGAEALSPLPLCFFLSGVAVESESSGSAQRCSGHSPAGKPFSMREKEGEKRKGENYRKGIRNLGNEIE